MINFSYRVQKSYKMSFKNKMFLKKVHPFSRDFDNYLENVYRCLFGTVVGSVVHRLLTGTKVR